MPQTGIAAAMKYFGKRNGQTLAEFKGEWDELSAESKAQILAGLNDGSLTY